MSPGVSLLVIPSLPSTVAAIGPRTAIEINSKFLSVAAARTSPPCRPNVRAINEIDDLADDGFGVFEMREMAEAVQQDGFGTGHRAGDQIEVGGDLVRIVCPLQDEQRCLDRGELGNALSTWSAPRRPTQIVRRAAVGDEHEDDSRWPRNLRGKWSR